MSAAPSSSSYRFARKGPEGKLLDWLDSIEQEGLAWRDRALRDADLYERIFFGGKRFSDATSIPRFRASVSGPTIRRRNALLTENKPIFKVEPLAEGLQNTADILNQLAEFAWQDHGFAGALETMVERASVICSAGMSLPFDSETNGGLGCIIPKMRDPRSVLIDPSCVCAADIGARSTKYVVIESVETIWDIQRDFPGRGMEVKPDKGLSSVVKTPSSGRTSPGDASSTSFKDRMKQLQEGPIARTIKKVYFVRDPALTPTGEEMYPLGRNIVRSGEVILSDGPSPWWDAEPDLVWFENRANFDNTWGASEVEALRYLQGAVNRIGEMFVNNTVLSGNSRVIADSDALGPDDINKLTNAEALVIVKRKMSIMTWEPPTPMPPHFLQFISFALRLVDYLIGLNDGQLEGRGRVEMRSGVQLEGLQNAAQVLIRAMARSLEEFIERLGRKFLYRVFQFYLPRANRILLSTGPSGQFQKFLMESDKLSAEISALTKQEVELKGGDYGKALKQRIQSAAAQFSFRVQPLSSLAQTKAARAQLLMSLVEMVMVPRELVLSELGYTNKNELLAKAKQEAMEMQAVMPQGPKKKSTGGGKAK